MKRRIAAFAVLAVFALTPNVFAGPMAELLGDGILGTTWGDDKAEVEAAHPGGKWKKIGALSVYTVRDGRAIFGVNRNKNDALGFAFTADGKLSSISIWFPGKSETFAELLAATTQQFGPPLASEDERFELKYDLVTATGLKWAPDGPLSLTLSMMAFGFSIDYALSISHSAVDVSKSKGDLGLE